MVEVGIRELKANLSHYLRTVQAGVEVVVMSRGKIVARLIGAGRPSARSLDEALSELASEGLAELPDQEKGAPRKHRLVHGRGVPASEIVRRQRR
jgi:prevent-host-death family protein